MADEWQTRNSEVRYPLAEIDAAAAALSPQPHEGFMVDCRAFMNGQTEADVYLSRVVVEDTQITVDFSRYSDGELMVSGTLPWSSGGEVGEQKMVSDGPRVVLFTTGPAWVTPGQLDGAGSTPFTLNYDKQASRIEPGAVTGEGGVEKILLAAPYYDSAGELQTEDETWDPEDPDNQYGVTEQVIAGYNMQFTLEGGELEVDVVPGAGGGLVPCWYSVGEVIRTINRVPPDGHGNLRLTSDGCFRISRTNDEIGGVPVLNALWFFNDCPPCCECFDYTKASRAVSRMSAKFKDLNNALNNVIDDVQATYDEAIALINQNAPTMVAIRNIHVYPSHISFDVANVSHIPLYAVVSMNLGYDLRVLNTGDIRPGIISAEDLEAHLDSIPESLEAHYQATDHTDPSQVEGYIDVGEEWTVGYGPNFEPIPPGEHTRIWLRSDTAFDALDCFDEECQNYQDYLNDVKPDPVTDDDWADLLSRQAALLDIIDPQCVDGRDLDCADEEKCWHQQMARIQQYYDIEVEKLVYRIKLAFGVVGDPCYAPTITGEISSLLEDYLATNDIVPIECKDGEGPDYNLVASTGDDENCDYDGHDGEPWDQEVSQCRAWIRQQMAERELILYGEGGPVTESTEVDTGVAEQLGLLAAVRARIEERYDEMVSQVGAAHLGTNVGSVGFSAFGIYSDPPVYSCTAFTKLFEVGDDETTPDDLNPFDCISGILGVHRYSVQRSDIELPEPPPESSEST